MRLPRLNRTSVGLKLSPIPSMRISKPLPQSNQRGIETPDLHEEGDWDMGASIEPAWD